jgi:nicotinamide riboside transporter PnuC
MLKFEMKRAVQKGLIILRWIYAIFFFLIGARSMLVLAGLLPASEYPGSPESKAFSESVFETGFISIIMSVTFFVAGILMVIKRTTPLGLVLIAPFIVAILFTHLLFEPNPIVGILVTTLWLLLALQFRKAFRPLWSYHENSGQNNKRGNEKD